MEAVNFLPLLFTVIIIGQASPGYANVFDISKYGAKPDGDATQAFMDAWKDACASASPCKILAPAGSYSLNPITLKGPCQSKIEIEIVGNFKAPANPTAFKGEDTWFKVERVDGLTVTGVKGGAMFDGQGEMGWKQNADCSQTGKCGNLPFNFRFNYVTNSVVKGITSLNSKLFHMHLLGCKNVLLDELTITAPGNSPNTDGIHIGRSDFVNVTRSNIGTGSDCISMSDGTRDVLVQDVNCGPGHGISVGSLGKYPNEQPVKGVTVRHCKMKNTENGVRIKTWMNSYKMEVSGLLFEDIEVENVTYPVNVDQQYCPYEHCETMMPSKVRISDVKFKNVWGTAASKEAVRIVCSSKFPCEQIELFDINVDYKGNDGPAVSVCKNVNKPIIGGKQNPPACKASAEKEL